MYAAVFPYLGAEAAAEELRIPPPPDLWAAGERPSQRAALAVCHRAGPLGRRRSATRVM